MTVLVLDGDTRASLAIVRSLGRRGIDVDVGETTPYSLCSFSKYCERSLTYADPQRDRQAFVDDLVDLLRETSYEMVFAAREVTTLPLSYHRERLSEYTTIPFPGRETMETTVDKLATFEVARDVGVPMPRTQFIDDFEEFEDRREEIRLPVVVKPRSKTTWIDETPVMLKVTDENYVRRREDLAARVEDLVRKTGRMPVVQEYVPGDGYGAEGLFVDGESRGVFMHRRLREYPVSGGASTLRESVYRADVEAYAEELMGALDWTGVAMVEFRLDERDDTPKLIEVNGRFWGSLPLAVAAGADFPHALYRLYAGEPIPEIDYRRGVKSRWLLPGDLLWLASTLGRGATPISTLSEFARFRDTNYDIPARDDPLPTLGAFGTMARRGLDVLRGDRSLEGEVTTGGHATERPPAARGNDRAK